jgi:hypothetical protein
LIGKNGCLCEEIVTNCENEVEKYISIYKEKKSFENNLKTK